MGVARMQAQGGAPYLGPCGGGLHAQEAVEDKFQPLHAAQSPFGVVAIARAAARIRLKGKGLAALYAGSSPLPGPGRPALLAAFHPLEGDGFDLRPGGKAKLVMDAAWKIGSRGIFGPRRVQIRRKRLLHGPGQVLPQRVQLWADLRAGCAQGRFQAPEGRMCAAEAVQACQHADRVHVQGSRGLLQRGQRVPRRIQSREKAGMLPEIPQHLVALPQRGGITGQDCLGRFKIASHKAVQRQILQQVLRNAGRAMIPYRVVQQPNHDCAPFRKRACMRPNRTGSSTKRSMLI